MISYTLLAMLAVAIAGFIDMTVTKSKVIATGAFWFAEIILVCFQLATNSWLTGRGIVKYDEAQIIGLRIAHAPIEDLLFGFSLILLTITVWVRLGRNLSTKKVDH